MRAISDKQTLAAYDSKAADFAKEWHEQPPPSDLQAVIGRFFKPGLVADVGCGSGREVAWLAETGYSAIGYDPSEGLLKEARRRYPGLDFRRAELPGLSGVAPASFDNVLCETVLMHLDLSVIASSVRRLVSMLRPGGTLHLSWRVSESDQRDQHGRLYTAFDKSLVTAILAKESILMEEEVISASSGRVIRRVVARRNSTRH